MDRPSPLDSLDVLYARSESKSSAGGHGAGWSAYAAILDRLAANKRVAQSSGWTSCAIEREGGAGRFAAWGVPPGRRQRHPIPDWSAEP